MQTPLDMSEIIWPLASADLATQIIEFIAKVAGNNQKDVVTGANEVTKALNKNRASLVILTADTKPVEILMHLPLLCEDKNVPYVWIPSSQALGRAAGISRPAIAVAIRAVEPSERSTAFGKEVQAIRTQIEQIH